MEISLALGGGGARGLAHIGVLKSARTNGYGVRAVAGTSMGGVIAAAYASGLSPQEIAESADGIDIKGMLELRAGGPSVFGLDRIQAWLEDLLGDRTFDELVIPLAVTATDLTACREVVLTEGKVVKAVMATIALPGLFPPQRLRRRPPGGRRHARSRSRLARSIPVGSASGRCRALTRC